MHVSSSIHTRSEGKAVKRTKRPRGCGVGKEERGSRAMGLLSGQPETSRTTRAGALLSSALFSRSGNLSRAPTAGKEEERIVLGFRGIETSEAATRTRPPWLTKESARRCNTACTGWLLEAPLNRPTTRSSVVGKRGFAFCGRRGIAGSLEEARKADSPFWQVLRDRSDYEAAAAAVQANCVRDTCSRWEPHVIPCPGPKNAASRKSDTNRDFGIFRVGW